MGKIFNIQRFSTSDGEGIRTVVFLKGCPLSCAWCHNPESQRMEPELFFQSKLCIGCGACTEVCRESCHRITAENLHLFDRELCVHCGSCAEVCPTRALQLCGEEKSADEVIAEVLKDKLFYEESGGGVTLSGGEPLLQYDFSKEILQKAKGFGMDTAIETSGYSQRSLDEILDYVDLWLFDIKLTDGELHKKYTGVSNELIMKNLKQLDALGEKIILRCPIMPGINLTDEHFMRLAAVARELHNISGIHIEPYHPLGISKAAQLEKTQAYGNTEFLSGEELAPFVQKLRENTETEVTVM